MHRLHAWPDLRAMFRRLCFAALVGIFAALAVACFRHAMLLLEWVFLSNDSGSLVNAATGLSPWRRALATRPDASAGRTGGRFAAVGMAKAQPVATARAH